MLCHRAGLTSSLLSVCNDENPCEGMSRHATFENFGMAFLTLFQVSTGDNWNGIMKVLPGGLGWRNQPDAGTVRTLVLLLRAVPTQGPTAQGRGMQGTEEWRGLPGTSTVGRAEP